MATLDERYLDGPNVGYCSSSEDEGDAQPEPSGGSLADDPRAGPKTGPKGVLADYRHSKFLAKLEKIQDEAELLEQAQRFTLTGNANKEDSEDEDELEAIRRRRMEHLKNMNQAKIVEIPNKNEFLNVIDYTQNGDIAVIHIYRDDMEATQTLNEALMDLAAETKRVRYYKVRASALDMTKDFNERALPTLQIYQNERLIGNLVRITDSLTEDFDVRDLKSLLQEQDITLPTE